MLIEESFIELNLETLPDLALLRHWLVEMTATIHDVARVAGVGIGTVSRVINNSPGVSPATREKVLAAIAQLNYKPDPIARSMISRRTGAIGVVVPYFTRPFNTEILRGVEAALARTGRELILYNVETDEHRNRYFSQLPMRRKVDGLLIISLLPEESCVRSFHEAGLPTVLVDAYSPLLTSLVVDNIEGAYQAIKYLIEKGHRRIGFINGIIEGNFKFNPANDRLIGLHRAFGEISLQFDPRLMLTSPWSRQEGKKAALELLQGAERPTAIFAASDVQAIGVLEAAKLLHIVVPDELSVIGYDGIEMAELLGLTTIEQPMQRMGKLGIEKLIEHIDNPRKEPELIRMSTKLVKRATTGTAPHYVKL
jgi:LacI family transcriptional regulator